MRLTFYTPPLSIYHILTLGVLLSSRSPVYRIYIFAYYISLKKKHFMRFHYTSPLGPTLFSLFSCTIESYSSVHPSNAASCLTLSLLRKLEINSSWSDINLFSDSVFETSSSIKIYNCSGFSSRSFVTEGKTPELRPLDILYLNISLKAAFHYDLLSGGILMFCAYMLSFMRSEILSACSSIFSI